MGDARLGMRVGACEVRAAATMTSPCNAVPPTCKCKCPALQLFIAPSHPRLHTPTAPARPPARPPGLLPSGPSWHVPQPMHHILQHQSKPSRAGQAAAIQSCTLMSHQPPACASCAACHMHLAGPAARESQHSAYLCAPGGGDEWCATRSCCWPPLPATPHPAAPSRSLCWIHGTEVARNQQPGPCSQGVWQVMPVGVPTSAPCPWRRCCTPHSTSCTLAATFSLHPDAHCRKPKAIRLV